MVEDEASETGTSQSTQTAPTSEQLSFRLPGVVYGEMLAHVQAGYPNEACGVLAGMDGRVVQHYAATNVSETPETFSEIGSQELLAIWQEVDARDWMFLAYYHSHPHTPAFPSPRDIVLAQGWPGTFSLIFSLSNPQQPVLRAFQVAADRSIREYVVVIEG